MIRFICLAVLASALVAAPAHSQSRRELGERIDATEVRIGELEASFLAGDPVAENLLQRLEALDYQVREMTGEVERLSFENRQLRDQIDMMQMTLDATSAPVEPLVDDEAAAWMNEGLEEAGAETSELPAAAGPSSDGAEPADMARAGPVSATDSNTLYDGARTRLLDGDFAGAQSNFETFVANHGDDPRIGEAQYWLGETHFVRNNFAEAADAYIGSLRSQPEGEKAPDALIRLAASLHGLGRTDEACGTLARFGRQFPDASQASRDRAARESVRANCQ